MDRIGTQSTKPSLFSQQQTERRETFTHTLDGLAEKRDHFRQKHAYYYDEIERVARSFIPEGARVLEIGCSTGDLLARLKPSRGVGIDLSPRMIDLAKAKHPGLEFHVGNAEAIDLDETFDFVIMSDVVGYLDDVWAAMRGLRRVMNRNSRLFLTYYNFVWEPLLKLAGSLGQKLAVPEQNWLGRQDLQNLLGLNQLEVVHSGSSLLLPARIPVISDFVNRFVGQLPGVRHLSLMQYFLARPVWEDRSPPPKLSCTVVVPCRNELGNIEDIFARTPELGAGTELIFVDGNSEDGTVAAIEKLLPTRPGTKLILQGDGKGKGDAVRKGFAAATGDVLFILDADLTVPPEDLPKFLDALAEGTGEFINGSRLVYPMEGEAMRFLNLLGNKFFSMMFTWILGRSVKDTLCGTKVLRRSAYEQIVRGRSHFGEFDPFGDFDLLFGAARLGLAIVDVPVRYRARTYGETKIDRFKHGFLLLKMTAIGLQKLKLTR